MKTRIALLSSITLLVTALPALTAFAEGSLRAYEIWEPNPAPNNGRSQWEATKDSKRPRSYDRDWEQWSYPLGNGYAGVCVFGRTDTERIQITDKTLHNKGIYKKGGLTSFAELYLDFNQDDVRNYRRSLNLNDAIAHVAYEKDGVTFKREYFASYPDNMIVIRLTADQKGALSFTVRPEIPYLEMKERTGTVTAAGNLLTLKGSVPVFSCNYEGQIKVLNEGGSVSADAESGTIEVNKADAVTLLITTGTNYRLNAKTFSNPPEKKLDPNQFPHDAVSARIQAAEDFGYAALKERHLKDYQNLFGRVSVNLNSTPSADPTHLLLEKVKAGETNTWLEELMFQYGRYLLIASSREKSLPANLQGAWSQDYHTPWSGGFWHNINVQMNYWGALSANLPECFEAYIAYFKAYLPPARQHAADYVRKHNPKQLTEGGDNGWIIGTGANAYRIPGAGGGHSGPGTGGFTAKLLVDYYRFTQDREFLEEVAYPAMLSLSRFYSKALVPHGDLLLVEPSASPEQIATPEQVKGMPGRLVGNKYYMTAGCTFDQGFVWESYSDTLAMADKLGNEDPFLNTIREQINWLDPIQIGADGQIKEYREEKHYSDIGQAKHRHISHLCTLYPGTQINSDHADWMQAASKTLDLRGNKTTGWALAHRMNSRARLGEGEKAHEVYQRFIRERTLPNLWTVHPPFQIDGSLGTMAGVAEMLLQSHENVINILPALPKAWNTGSFDGLVARGNFVVSAEWTKGKATAVSLLSRSGGECRVACPGIESATVRDSDGNTVKVSRDGNDRIHFASTVGETYTIEFRQEPENGFGIERPAGKNLGAIWFIGDSITQSNADGDPNGSPRKSLYDLLKANGYSFSYTGHHTRNVDGLPMSGNAPADNLFHYHTGISGYLITKGSIENRERPLGGMGSGLPKYWKSGRLASVKPVLILIMIGTNDIGHGYELAGAPARLATLLDDIYALPGAGTPTLFLASVPPNRRNEADRTNVIHFNESIPGIVDSYRAKGKKIFFVDQFTPLDNAYYENMRGDNLHPNATGNDTMAQTWFKAIQAVFSAPVAVEEVNQFPGKKTDFRGFERYDVPTAKGIISVVCPKKAAPGKPWLWRSQFWGNAHAVKPFLAGDLQLLEQGYHVVKAPGDVSGHPKGNESIDAAYHLLTQIYGFSKTLSMASMSRETLALFRWATENPEKVESIYVDNGVCNVHSWPAGKLVPGSQSNGTGSARSWELLKKTYGFSSDKEALAAKVSPVDLLEPLARAGIPILMRCGTKDTTVPYEENGAILKERFEKMGGGIQIIFEEKDHHPHGLNDPTPVLEFIKKNTKTETM